MYFSVNVNAYRVAVHERALRPVQLMETLRKCPYRCFEESTFGAFLNLFCRTKRVIESGNTILMHLTLIEIHEFWEISTLLLQILCGKEFPFLHGNSCMEK